MGSIFYNPSPSVSVDPILQIAADLIGQKNASWRDQLHSSIMEHAVMMDMAGPCMDYYEDNFAKENEARHLWISRVAIFSHSAIHLLNPIHAPNPGFNILLDTIVSDVIFHGRPEHY